MNPFLAYADSILMRRKKASEPRIVQRESQAPKVLSPAEKEIREQTTLLRRYHRYKMADLKKLLDGECGEEIRQLQGLLRSLAPASGPELLQFMEDHDWFRHLDRFSRYAILDLIDAGIIRMRIRQGWSPIDDSLPGETQTIFETIRANMLIDEV